MGREKTSITISAKLSNHNGDQDQIDLDLWDDLMIELLGVLKNDKYNLIEPYVD